ncbi:MAG: hypothetical protein ACR2PM_12000 [Hyphomicrobiales bacterium]
MKTLMKMAMVLAPVAAMTFSTVPANAQKRCVAHDGAVKQLAKKYKEQVVGRGLAKGNKTMVELFVSKKGSWTLVATNTKGASCVVAAGENWFEVPVVPVVAGETS